MHDREEAARRVCARLREAGYHTLWAGGCVRDLLLGIPPKDYDIATSAPLSVIRGLFGHTVDVGAAFGVLVVREGEAQFEVACFRSDGPYRDGRRPDCVTFSESREDALRRDFTINALFLDPDTMTVLDYVNGEADLRKGIIRAVGNAADRFREDHLRLLRAARFAARFGFTIATETEEAMRECAGLILRISPERVRDELQKMLCEGGAENAFRILARTGLLRQMLPEIAAMQGIEQPEEFHPEGDVFEHTMACLRHLKQPTPTLAWGVLLHDVGKPVTQRFEDRIRFDLHDKAGARMAEAVLRRLRCPNDTIETVCWHVEQHMRFAHTLNMRESRRKRFMREPHFGELAALCRIDCAASHGDCADVDRIEACWKAMEEEEIRPAPLLSGRDLIAMGYVPGPLFAEILEQVEDGQLEGELGSREQARAWVRKRWPLPEISG